MMPGMAESDEQVTLHGRVALYRFYDRHEALLYVGISNDPRRRLKEHAAAKSWYPRIQHQAITWYDSEAQARAAEDRAILGERPEYNIAGAIRPQPARPRMNPRATPTVLGVILGATTAICVTAGLAPWPWYVALTAMAAQFVTMTLILLAIIAPWIAQLGNWVDRNFSYILREDGQ